MRISKFLRIFHGVLFLLRTVSYVSYIKANNVAVLAISDCAMLLGAYKNE